MNWKRAFQLGSLGFLLCTMLTADAQETRDKSQYHLFNPVPRELMRELSADRPDLTESPYTVDAGHYQIEMDVVAYSYDRYHPDGADVRVESFSIAPINLKAGLLNDVDLQVALSPYEHVRIDDRGIGRIEHFRGFGDIETRVKINLWGNDSGSTAMAAMPFVKIPTNQDDLGNRAWEGGLILPFSVDLPRDWGLGLMTEVDIREDLDESGYHPEFINTAVLGHSIAGNLSGYAEFFSLVSSEEDTDWVGIVGLGLTYLLTEDLQLDGGVNLGVTRSAEDVAPFVGLTWRF